MMIVGDGFLQLLGARCRNEGKSAPKAPLNFSPLFNFLGGPLTSGGWVPGPSPPRGGTLKKRRVGAPQETPEDARSRKQRKISGGSSYLWVGGYPDPPHIFCAFLCFFRVFFWPFLVLFFFSAAPALAPLHKDNKKSGPHWRCWLSSRTPLSSWWGYVFFTFLRFFLGGANAFFAPPHPVGKSQIFAVNRRHHLAHFNSSSAACLTMDFYFFY